MQSVLNTEKCKQNFLIGGSAAQPETTVAAASLQETCEEKERF